MAKFVCDFETVNVIANNLKKVSEEMTKNMDDFKSNLSSDLSTWSGDAKNNFIVSNESKAETIKSNIDQINQLSEFIKTSSEKIKEAESQLASLSI